ncbi:Uncharacterised protein [Paenibacillus thiaminolyticus]|nr:Uncharacterised protein [Paenibacillus thiaminolyticus]
MMHIEQEQMAFFPELNHLRAQQRGRAKIKRADECPDLLVRPAFVRVLAGYGERDFVMDLLHRLAVHDRKRGTQRLMAINKRLECRFETLLIQWTCQLERRRHIVTEACLIQLVEHIQSCLRRR